MATLREFQLALQEKLEEIRQRDEMICELEDELADKELTVERLKAEVKKLRSLMSGQSYGAGGGGHGHAPLLSVPSAGTGRTLQGRQMNNNVAYFSQRSNDNAAPATTTNTGFVTTTLPRFRLPQPVSSSLMTRIGLAKSLSGETPSAMTSSSSGESNENGQTRQN